MTVSISTWAEDALETIAHWEQFVAVPEITPRGDATGARIITSRDPDTGHRLNIYFPAKYFSCPAEQLEKREGLTGISKKYTLPAGVDEVALQTYAQIVWHSRLRGDITPEQEIEKHAQTLAVLKKLNPELSRVPPQARAYDVIQGVASRFNVDDIIHYTSNGGGLTAMAQASYRNLFNSVSDRTGDMSWMPAVSTLNNIGAQTHIRNHNRRIVHKFVPNQYV